MGSQRATEQAGCPDTLTSPYTPSKVCVEIVSIRTSSGSAHSSSRRCSSRTLI